MSGMIVPLSALLRSLESAVRPKGGVTPQGDVPRGVLGEPAVFVFLGVFAQSWLDLGVGSGLGTGVVAPPPRAASGLSSASHEGPSLPRLRSRWGWPSPFSEDVLVLGPR